MYVALSDWHLVLPIIVDPSRISHHKSPPCPHPNAYFYTLPVLLALLFLPICALPTQNINKTMKKKQVGLGFAAGAMFWVACFELFSEAVEDSSKLQASLITAVSFAVMLCVHSYFEHGV